MSVTLPIARFTKDQQNRLVQDLFNKEDNIRCFFTTKDKQWVIVPHAYGMRHHLEDIEWAEPSPMHFDESLVKKPLTEAQQLEMGTPIDTIRDQEGVVREVLEHIPEGSNSRGSVFLNLPTGYGKTNLTVYLTTRWQRNVLILCHNQEVLSQWQEEYERLGCRVHHLKACDRMESCEPADVYLCGIQAASKLRYDRVRVGVVVYDEAHEATKTGLTESLLRVRPDILVMLTATAYRQDGLERYFEQYVEHFIKRSVKRMFRVHRCISGLVPTVRQKWIQGAKRIDYDTMIRSIMEKPEITTMIVNLILSIPHGPDNRLLVLFNRNTLLESVSALLEFPHTIINKTKSRQVPEDHGCVLIIDKKGKLGLNIPNASKLIITFSTNDVHQMQGRVRRDDFDLYLVQHDHGVFAKHIQKNLEFLSEIHRENVYDYYDTITMEP